MFRFIAFSWNSNDSEKTLAAQRLCRQLLSFSPDCHCVFDTPGLRVLHARQPRGAYRAYILKRNTGVVLGKLFHGGLDKDCTPSDPTFDDKESDLIVASRGRRLVENYWGHYVAFLRERNGGRRFVIRDPTGGLPCFVTSAAGIDIILSDAEDCIRLKSTPFTVDWNHLTAFFLHMRLVTRTTGFREITNLHAGECVMMQDDAATARMTRTFYWDPTEVYSLDTIEDPSAARMTLRSTVQHCINAWASCYDSIVHELSGGLDSSIVAVCLTRGSARPEVLCFHYFTEMLEGDERSYARAAAQSAGCELIESEVRVSERPLGSLLDLSRLATPAVLGFLPASEVLKQRLVIDRRAGAVFSGRGGDHLFQEGRNALIAAEYVHRHGVRPKLFRVIKDISCLTKQSLWSVFGAAVGYGMLRRTFDPYAAYKPPPILTADALASLTPHSYTHPWVENASRMPASKIEHIFNIVDCQLFYQKRCANAEQIHPLISQPIIERCLQIPTYVLAHHGRSRGLIREAFKADLPESIVHRQWKGGTTSYFNRLIAYNATFLRERLLDGVLVRERILNKNILEKQLSESELILGTGLLSILSAIRAETWLSTWADVRYGSAP